MVIGIFIIIFVVAAIHKPEPTSTPLSVSNMTPLSIVINSPSNGQIFRTTIIDVNGTASDNVFVSKVEVRVGQGKWQNAFGTTSWEKSVTIAAGSNVIYARATDATGSSKIASVTVVYNPAAIKIMPLGDSITELTDGYRNSLWKLLSDGGYNVEFVGSQSSGPDTLPEKNHEGHIGYRIDEISDGINAWLDAYKPDIILLHIGTNDITQNYYLATAPDRLSTLIDKIAVQSPHTVILVASLIPRRTHNDANIAYNEAIPDIVGIKQRQGKNIYFVNMYNESQINTATDLFDDVHPNRNGSYKMAAVWYYHLKSSALYSAPALALYTPAGTYANVRNVSASS